LVEDVPPNQPSPPQPGQQRRLLLGLFRGVPRTWGTSDEIHLTVSDSGAGFDREAAKTSRGLGLISMEERLKLVNGTLSIDNAI